MGFFESRILDYISSRESNEVFHKQSVLKEDPIRVFRQAQHQPQLQNQSLKNCLLTNIKCVCKFKS